MLGYGYPPEVWAQLARSADEARGAGGGARRQPDMQRSVNRAGQSYVGSAPAADQREPQEVVVSPECYFVYMDVPGYSKADITITFGDGGVLDVAGQRKQDPRRRSGGVHFKKSWVVPEDVKVDAISAKVENGELVIELPRQKMHPRSFRVPVLGGSIESHSAGRQDAGSEKAGSLPSPATEFPQACNLNKPAPSAVAQAQQEVQKEAAKLPPTPELQRQETDGSIEDVPDDEEGSVPQVKRQTTKPLKEGPVLMRVASSAVDDA